MEVIQKRAIDDLHRVNQVVQHKIIIKKIQKNKHKKDWKKEEECLLRLKKKENNSRKKIRIEFILASSKKNFLFPIFSFFEKLLKFLYFI